MFVEKQDVQDIVGGLGDQAELFHWSSAAFQRATHCRIVKYVEGVEGDGVEEFGTKPENIFECNKHAGFFAPNCAFCFVDKSMSEASHES